MEPELYEKISTFKRFESLPTIVPSTKSNFIALATKFQLNEKMQLTRNSKLVLKTTDLERTIEYAKKLFWGVWNEIHGHAGINITWKKFNDRFWMLGGEKWVRKMCGECVACSHKNSNIWPAQTAPLQPIATEAKASWRIHSNII